MAKKLGALTGIPVRIYKGKEEIFYYSTVSIPKDPLLLYLDQVFSIKENVGYYMTKNLHTFGVVRKDDYRYIIGPSLEIQEDEKSLKIMAFDLGIEKNQTMDFINAVKSITRMPLPSLLEVLLAVNLFLNGEMKELHELTLSDSIQEELKHILEKETKGKEIDRVSQSQYEESPPNQEEHNTYAQEQEIMMLIRKGETEKLKDWISSAPAIRGGTIAVDGLRQVKNMFVVSVTLASRAAIQGGVDPVTALSVSDGFIKRCELLYSVEKITNLQYLMVLEYAGMVRRVRQKDYTSPLVMKVANYVVAHITEPLTTEQIADALYLSRPYLSSRFHKEAGRTLYSFIMDEKIEEAKRLILYSGRSISSISQYLGFSSLGHFSSLFKKNTGYSPTEFRSL
ncbi:MAG: helix-turn-helix domain-containing protein [Candidatus Ornithospirochaeta sp.]